MRHPTPAANRTRSPGRCRPARAASRTARGPSMMRRSDLLDAVRRRRRGFDNGGQRHDGTPGRSPHGSFPHGPPVWSVTTRRLNAPHWGERVCNPAAAFLPFLRGFDRDGRGISLDCARHDSNVGRPPYQKSYSPNPTRPVLGRPQRFPGEKRQFGDDTRDPVRCANFASAYAGDIGRTHGRRCADSTGRRRSAVARPHTAPRRRPITTTPRRAAPAQRPQ